MHSIFHNRSKLKLKLKPKPDPQHQENSFIRKYQEFVNQHRVSHSRPLSNIIKSQRAISLKNLREIRESSKVKSVFYKTSRHKNFKDINPRPQPKIKTSSESSLEISAILSRQTSTQTISPNPEKNWAQAVSKIQQIEHQSYQNVLLNKKLGLNLNTKNQLEAYVQKLKQQMFKQKNKKERTIKNIQKMINQLSNTQEIIERIQKKRNHLQSQIMLCSKELNHQQTKRQSLELIHMKNLKTIKQDKKLIEFYQQKNEQSKASLILQRYQLNVTKDKYFIERNRLLKNEGKFEQNSHQREKIYRSVSKNARGTIIDMQVSI